MLLVCLFASFVVACLFVCLFVCCFCLLFLFVALLVCLIFDVFVGSLGYLHCMCVCFGRASRALRSNACSVHARALRARTRAPRALRVHARFARVLRAHARFARARPRMCVHARARTHASHARASRRWRTLCILRAFLFAEVAPRISANISRGAPNFRLVFADGHTVSNAPDLFRPPKLSGTGPG